MGYTLIKAFERGIDTRKLIDTIEAGALLDARDCHVTLGGEIEKRAAFSVMATLPSTTVGLYVTEGRVLNTWGTAATAPGGMPPNSVYHPIPHPDGIALTHIMSVEEFNGGLYVIAQYESGNPLHWWNDTLVRENPIPPGDDGSGGTTTPPPTGPANKPQTNFYLQLTGGTTPPPYVYVQWVYLVAPASTYNFGPTGTIDAYMLIPQDGVASGFPFCNTQFVAAASNEAQVTSLIAGLINSTVTTPKVYASNSGINLSPVFVDDANTTYNGWKIEIALSNCRVWPSGSEALSGGVAPPPGPPPPSPAPSGPLPPINKGTFAIAHNEHMWAVQDVYLNRSATRKPDEWEDQQQGAGQFNMTMITPRKPKLISLAEYRTDLAIFAKRHVIIYHMDELAAQSFKRQVLHNTGTFAPHSVTSFGEGEVMYLDISGIRSLRARDSSDAAFAADIGNMIDELVKAKIPLLTPEQQYHRVWGLVEPRSGRLWMAMWDKIFVLSYYPSSRIAAWTWYDATTAPVDMANTSDDSVYWRSGNNVICYGGEAGTVYDATEALIRVPYIDAGKPATHKNWQSIDMALYGTWTVRSSFDPTVPAALDLIANLTKSTYAQQKIAMNGESPGVSLQLTSTFVGPSKVGNAAVHFTDSTAD